MASKRVVLSEGAHVEVLTQKGEMTAILRNISKSGARLEFYEGDYVPQLGDVLHVNSALKDAFAEVVWSKQQEVGICFVPSQEIYDRLMRRTDFGIG